MLFEHPYKSQFSPTHYVRYKIFSKFCGYLLWTFKRPPLKFLLIHIHLSFRFLKVFWTTLMNAFTTTDWHTKTTMCMCNCIMINISDCGFWNIWTTFYHFWIKCSHNNWPQAQKSHHVHSRSLSSLSSAPSSSLPRPTSWTCVLGWSYAAAFLLNFPSSTAVEIDTGCSATKIWLRFGFFRFASILVSPCLSLKWRKSFYRDVCSGIISW